MFICFQVHRLYLSQKIKKIIKNLKKIIKERKVFHDALLQYKMVMKNEKCIPRNNLLNFDTQSGTSWKDQMLILN